MHFANQNLLFNLCLVALPLVLARASDATEFEFSQQTGKVIIQRNGAAVATYVYEDPEISRPYFAHVKTPDGIQVTRNHPPIEGKDLADHGTFHPGLWLAFGDINGSDYWRLKSAVRHHEFLKEPGGNGFVVRNQYLDQRDQSQVVCEEVARYAFAPHASGYFLLWDSKFTSDHSFYFGDQEEMGLGFRVATPLRVEREAEGNVVAGQGEIRDAKGRRNGDQVWGNSADWADYSGVLDGKLVGMTIFCHPENFRPSWFHARDYGFIAANPFGRHAFGKGDTSKVAVEPGETLRLQYGIFVHESEPDNPPDLVAAYQDYVRLTAAP